MHIWLWDYASGWPRYVLQTVPNTAAVARETELRKHLPLQIQSLTIDSFRELLRASSPGELLVRGECLMEHFDHILNWKLTHGSHQFPGKDGGTCINEAAIVAAGFEYQPIHDAVQMPQCFSRPICRLAMRLNDNAADDERQLLLPFVTRLACADTPDIEHEREIYIRSQLTEPVDIGRGIEVLEGALAIGRQAEPLAPDVARARMEALQEQATTDTSIAESP